MRSFRSVRSLSTSSAMVLLSCSLVIDTDHDVCWFARCVSVAFAAADDRLVRRREGVPLLRLGAEREVRAEEVRLVEVEPHAAIERRPAHVRAGRPRAAQEVHVVVLGVDARLLLGAVARRRSSRAGACPPRPSRASARRPAAAPGSAARRSRTGTAPCRTAAAASPARGCADTARRA